MVGVRGSRTIKNDRSAGHGRPVPRRGQVKVGIVLGLAHSVASLFSFNNARFQSGSQPWIWLSIPFSPSFRERD
ncbi:hypothetical protein Ccrd_000991 [Cynara cardunculus var. scolymus]|uniref:Uncharacterized protein n=1 Tax=Cynara cardunculus var. scolymus TaxID=59895 RepID=A0A103XU65_CYNCS|nr:hypothetical protein Ccrd_000991 [Cynara cardunculus var. scolymus]